MSFKDPQAAHSTAPSSKDASREPSSYQHQTSLLEPEVPEQIQPAMNGTSSQAEPAPTQRSHDSPESEEKEASILKGKQRELPDRKKDGPLELLDLPLDILKCIIKEVTHTNDLTSLALTNSALNNLAIPNIYSRFDIVWPDAHASSEPRSGVDALTYGLATLVMREDLFDYVPPHAGCPGQSSSLGYTCNHCGMANDISVDSLKPKQQARCPRRGNLFSQYTRKFSLGNGPADWVQEYLISKEGGKMLGTLIALTLARMPNLETLIWDMPTGIVREVWHALASLGDRRPTHRSRLEKVWVRLHDNREVNGAIPANVNPNSSSPAVPLTASSANSGFVSDVRNFDTSYHRIEHPSFSVLPALRSLSVLELDEVAYLKEMSILVHRSRDSLRELRIGLSKAWAPVVTQADASSEPLSRQCRETGCFNDGGVLGLIMNQIYDCRRTIKSVKTITEGLVSDVTSRLEQLQSSTSTTVPPLIEHLSTLSMLDEVDGLAASTRLPDSPNEEESTSPGVSDAEVALPPMDMSVLDTPSLKPSLFSLAMSKDPQKLTQPRTVPNLQVVNTSYQDTVSTPPSKVDTGKDPEASNISKTKTDESRQTPLRLEIFELERVHLSVTVLQRTIDWSMLTALTLLDCGDHERLWKTLRRVYTPRSTSMSGTSSLSSLTNQISQPQLRRVSSSRFDTSTIPEYQLKLKRIHTDNVSPALIAFLKETLAPNTLEWMLLQERGQYISPVTVEAIYRGPLRYHRSSLKKVFIDSSESLTDRGRSTKWKKWMLNHDVLTFITSGKMSCLRELGMALDHKDWHFFLQRLPNIPHLRSLYIPHIANYVYNHHLEAKELASQIVDLVIALRPEIELCYMGILTKCFEVLENRSRGGSHLSYQDSGNDPVHPGPGGVTDSDEDSEETDHDDGDDDDDDDSDDGPPAAAISSADSDGAESDVGNDSAGDTDDDLPGGTGRRKAPRFRLREILFYDDKISIFKARHGRL